MKNAPLTIRDIHDPYIQLLTNLQGDNGQEWLDALKKFNRKENPWGTNSSTINLSYYSSFDPDTFIGKGLEIVEEDKCSAALREIDLSKINLVTMLAEGEASIVGGEKLKRLKEACHVRLDAKMFNILWINQRLIPELWREKTNGKTTYIFFDGSILRNPDGNCCVLCLYWLDGEWCWGYRWLDDRLGSNCPSAVLASG